MNLSHFLKAQNLHKHIGKKNILKGVTIEVSTSQIVGLLGANGAGKTTAFYTICGILKPNEGNVFIDDMDITPYTLHQRAHMGVAYLPQEASIFKDLTVEGNLRLSAEIAYEGKPHMISEAINRALATFNIERIKDTYGYSLSGGERRRVEIARLLVKDPKFILLDEPFAGVDPISVSDIQDIIKQLKGIGIGVLITDHNVRETLGICDHAYVMNFGEIIAEGMQDDILNNKQVIKEYLGEKFKA